MVDLLLTTVSYAEIPKARAVRSHSEKKISLFRPRDAESKKQTNSRSMSYKSTVFQMNSCNYAPLEFSLSFRHLKWISGVLKYHNEPKHDTSSREKTMAGS